MEKRIIRLNGLKEILDFVEKANKVPCNLDLHSGRYYLDAKSTMGLFGIDTRKELCLEYQTEDKEIISKADNLFAEYIVC